MLSLISRFLPALLSGLLLGVSTLAHGPFSSLQWTVFFGLVPLWSSWLKEERACAVFLSGWLCQFTLGLVGFHWVAYTVSEFSHLGPLFSLGCLLLYCSVANLHLPLAGLAWHRFFRSSRLSLTQQLITLALLTAAAERLIPMIFHWNLGYAWLYLRWPGYQLAEWIGFRGLSTLTILLNGLLLLAGKTRRKEAIALALGLFALLNVTGLFLARQLPAPDRVARVLVVQPNLGNEEKERLEYGPARYKQEILQRYLRLTDQGLAAADKPVDFAMWPENAFPDLLAEPALTFRLSPRLREYLVARHLNLVTGSYGLNEKWKVTNSLFALNREGRWAGRPYGKLLLLPFGEYIPGAERFPLLKKWLPDVRDYGRGDSPVILELAGIRLGPQICYEGLFDTVARELARRGSQLIVNVTNDSWYGNWLEPWQHLYITAAKAVETRVPLLRATNTGVSAAILATGELIDLSPVGREWYHLYELPYLSSPPLTVFARWGFWIDGIFLAISLIWLAWRARPESRFERESDA